MELALDCGDVCHDVKLKVSAVYKKRCLYVDRGDIRSCSLCHLQEQLEKDRPGDSNYIQLLHLLGGLVEESDNDVLMTETDDDTDFNSHDPKYRIFLSHFKRQGKSYVAEFKEENGLCKFIEYETEDVSDSEHDFDIKREMQDDMKEESTENGGHPTKTPTVLLSAPQKEKRRPKIAKNAKSSSPGSVSLEKNDFPRQNLRAVKNRLKCDMECGIVKEQNTKLQRSSRVQVKSEEVSELDEKDPYLMDGIKTETAHCTIEISKCISSGKHDTRVKEEEDSCQYLGSPMQGIDSSFRQKVMSLLRKPYDHEEYKKLRDDIKVRKKLTRHRDLRNGRERPYSANEVGKSYLDHYKDLKQKIKAVQDDQCKELNILRGFFFWLQNLAHEGVFRPWQDAACLEVMPGSCGTFNP